MKKKIIAFIVASFTMILMCTMTAFAEEMNWDELYGEDNNSILTPEGTTVSRDQKMGNQRNEFLSTAIAQITNEGKGKLVILLHTMCHVNVDKIRHEAYLDQWDVELDDWVNVDSYEFEATKEDYPDGFYQYVESKEITNHPAGYSYRVRGLHGVWLNGEFDGFATATNGVLLTKD